MMIMTKNDNAVKPRILYHPENNIPIQGFVLHLWIILQPDVVKAVALRFAK